MGVALQNFMVKIFSWVALKPRNSRKFSPKNFLLYGTVHYHLVGIRRANTEFAVIDSPTKNLNLLHLAI